MPSRRDEHRTEREIIGTMNRLINRTNASEGTALPPKQFGPNRVPPPTNFLVMGKKGITGGTEFFLNWTNVTTFPNCTYIIKASQAVSQNYENTLFSTSVKAAPASVTVMGDPGRIIIFRIQTITGSGYSSLDESSPSASGVTV